jgi:hypothetical protein
LISFSQLTALANIQQARRNLDSHCRVESQFDGPALALSEQPLELLRDYAVMPVAGGLPHVVVPGEPAGLPSCRSVELAHLLARKVHIRPALVRLDENFPGFPAVDLLDELEVELRAGSGAPSTEGGTNEINSPCSAP